MISILSRDGIDTIEYCELLSSCTNTLIYVDLNYLDVISEYTNSKLYFVVDMVDNRIMSALPFCVYFGLYGPVINSLPFYGSNGGIISRSKKVLNYNLIIDAVLEFAKKIQCVSATIIESPLNVSDSSVFSKFNYRDSRISLLNYFEPSMESSSLIKSFQEPRPRNIRRALKDGIGVKQSHSLESMQFLAETHFKNISGIGGAPKRYDFFELIHKNLPTDQWIILDAFIESKRIASLLLLYSKDVIEYFTPATLLEYRNSQAQSLLIFNGMLFAIDKNINIWNWGGTWDSQKGVYDFKKKWGPAESKYIYYCAIFDESILDREKSALTKLYPYFYVAPFKELKV
jgi:FemAB family